MRPGRLQYGLLTLALLAAAGVLLRGRVVVPGLGVPYDREFHAQIGAVLAREALRCAGPAGEITVITRDTDTYPQPSLDAALSGFEREVRAAGRAMKPPLRIQVDPIRPPEVPSGDFFELLRRGASGAVIVSLLGPPMLTEEQRLRLGVVKPAVVALLPGPCRQWVDVGQLFRAGLLRAAVAAKSGGAGETKRTPAMKRPRWEDAYEVLRAPVASAEVSP